MKTELSHVPECGRNAGLELIGRVPCQVLELIRGEWEITVLGLQLATL
jgi:hypothetical protein